MKKFNQLSESYFHTFVIILLGTVSVFIVGAGVVAAETTWYVDDDGGVDFTKIQDAVDTANDGDTIYVYNGIYNECVIFYKPLIIQGENRETTIVDAGGGSKGMEITANDCIISGFTIRNCQDTGIKLSSSYNVISNNEIIDSGDEGIKIDGASHNTVTNNTIYSNTGIGIDVRGSLYNYIVNNIIYSNGDHGINLGRSWSTETVVFGSSHNTIISNVLYANDGDGIKLKNSFNNNITNNNISLSSDDGIGINNYSSYNHITYNNIFNNSDNGVDLENSSDNNITDNKIYLNNHTGIDFEGSSFYNSIINNNIFNNNNGIIIRDSINNNTIYNNYFNNTNNAFDKGSNTWNITPIKGINIIGGSWLGGNYWSDYDGVDLDGDDLGNSQYSIPGGNSTDKYPLISPSETTGTETISIGSSTVDINGTIIAPVTITNTTNTQKITFDLVYNPNNITIQSIFVNNTIPSSTVEYTIDTGTVTIEITNSEKFTVTSATPIIDITFQVAENTGMTALGLQNVVFIDDTGSHAPDTVTNGSITVCIKGDFNYNNKIDIGDVAKVAFMVAGKINKDPRADFNNNGQVDIGDAAKISFCLAEKIGEL